MNRETAYWTGRNAFESALDFADVHYSSDGLVENAEMWIDNKFPLIELLSTHPNWDEENLSVIIPMSYSYLEDKVEAGNAFWRMMGLFDGTIDNAEYTDMSAMSILLHKNLNNSMLYRQVPYTKERVTAADDLSFLKEVLGFQKVNVGMKYSRLFQSLFRHINPDAMENKEVQLVYSDWVDKITEKKAEYKFVLSANPADYVLMSYGNSWSSCHIVNPSIIKGKGSTFEGAWRAGTLSYMLDEQSLISYIVPAGTPDEKIFLVPKHNRQVFFINAETPAYLQSRMYPAVSNSPFYSLFRKMVQEILSTVLESSEPWVNHRYRVSRRDNLHYNDYNTFSDVCYAASINPPLYGEYLEFEAGNEPVCLECGDRHIDSSSTLYCDYCGDDDYCCCESCGERISDGDECWSETDQAYYCDYCYHDRFFSCADCSEETDRDDAMEGPDGYLYCRDCFFSRFYECENCGDIVENDDVEEIDNMMVCCDCYDAIVEEMEDC